MKNIVCVKINCYKGFSYEDTLDGIKKAGFKYLELSTSNGNSLNMCQDMSQEDIDKLKKDLNERGLQAIAIGGNSYLMDDDTTKIIKNIKLAKEFNCKYIDVTVYNARNDSEAITSDEDIVNHIKAYIPYLEENNLDLVIELHGQYSTGNKISNILKLVNNNHVHINYDTGNALFWGNLNVEEMLIDFNNNINNISFMHLKDKLGAINEWNFPAIGKGYIPFEIIFKELSENITLAVEIEFTAAGVKDVNEVHQALIDSATYLKSLGLI